MVDWFEDESFWKATEPFLFPPDRLASAPDEIGAVLSLAGVEDGDVLDLCCGPGRHSIELARRGFRVTGVDRSSFLLGRARDLASEAGVDVEWVRQDMRRFARDEAFDLVLSMFTSFGYFDDPSDDVAVLRNVHRSLRPGGTLVLDAAGKEWLAREFQPTTSEVLPDGAVLVQRHASRSLSPVAAGHGPSGSS